VSLRRRRRLPLSIWPIADQMAWSALFEARSPLDPDGSLAAWSSASRDLAMAAYAGWLGYCARRHPQLLEVAPGDRLEPAILAGYLAQLQKRVSSVTTAMYVAWLCSVMRAMAPKRDWGWLQELVRRLNRRAQPIRRKSSQLRHPRELFNLGERLMRDADVAATVDLASAARFRNGLMIALLAARPIRPRSLASLRLGHNLLRSGDHYQIALGPAEVKTRGTFDVVWPASLFDPLQKYLTVYRPRLMNGAASDFLWIANDGSVLKQQSMQRSIAKETRSAFGTAIYPHQFRHCAASAIAFDDPDHVEVVAALLGHTSLRTGERHYIHAQTIRAGRKHQEVLETIRDGDRRLRVPCPTSPADAVKAIDRLLSGVQRKERYAKRAKIASARILRSEAAGSEGR
jgi:integrase/recombinase XerD